MTFAFFLRHLGFAALLVLLSAVASAIRRLEEAAQPQRFLQDAVAYGELMSAIGRDDRKTALAL